MTSSLVPWGGGGRRGAYDPMTWDVWDPTDFGFGGFRRGGGGWGDRTEVDDQTPPFPRTCVDWRETNDAHLFLVDVPGVRREDLKVQVEDDNVLEISGEKIREQEIGGGADTWHRAERSHGSFRRRFRLPRNTDVSLTRCSLDHGVLTVTVPKRQVGMPLRNVRPIDIV